MAVRFTVDFCREQLNKYVEAESKVLNSQSYSIAGRSMTRANLKEIQDGITLWASRLAEAEKVAATGYNGIRMIRTIPHG